MKILGLHGGVSQLQNEASATLLINGSVIAACEEERFSRLKGAFGLIPIRSISACLSIGQISIEDVDYIVHTGATHVDLESRIQNYILHYYGYCPQIKIIEHQLAHIASAYYQSGLDSATCISYDGYGDNVSVAIAEASGSGINIFHREDIDNSLGRFYTAITSFLGFSAQESEYKVMGLAPYGKKLLDFSGLIDVQDEIRYRVDSSYFAGYGKSAEGRSANITSRQEPWYSSKLIELLGPPRRSSNIDQNYIDIAYTAQNAFENAAKCIVKQAIRDTGIHNVVLSGGCALNCKANMEIEALDDVHTLFVQPAASDRGLSLGAALALFNQLSDGSNYKPLAISDVFWGPQYSDEEIEKLLIACGISYSRVENISHSAANDLHNGKIVAWFQGRSEFGPRALGHRSILADPTRSDAKSLLNSKVKYREEFRPFAPAVCEESASEYFCMDQPSPFMTKAVKVREAMKEILKATTHVDGTARVQTVNKKTDPAFHSLIKCLGVLNGTEVVLNTSFNVMGEPIVETPRNALATFYSSGIDSLYIGNYKVEKDHG